MQRIVVTGGAGFIGSYVVDGVLGRYSDVTVTVLDALTYAGDLANLESAIASNRVDFVQGDICDEPVVRNVIEGADVVIHVAAESHVDRSFQNAKTFLDTNVTGSHHVFQACHDFDVPRVMHFSTDEVYGPRDEDDEALEDSVLGPTNPYSASKAAAEMMAVAAYRAHGMPITIVRPNNVYGGRQFPEKLIPLFVLAAAAGEPLTIHGAGQQRRRFLAVEDLVEGLLLLLERGSPGKIYNIGTPDAYSILDIVDLVGTALDIDTSNLVQYVQDRPFNDRFYATNCEQLCAMGWRPKRTLREDFPALVDSILAQAKRRAAREEAVSFVAEAGSAR